MLESEFSKGLIVCLKRILKPDGFVVFKHNERITPGVPDMSVTGLGCTSWGELKVTRTSAGRIESTTALKEDILRKLANGGLCYYIILHGALNLITVSSPLRTNLSAAHMGADLVVPVDDYASVARYIHRLHRAAVGREPNLG